MNFKNYRRNFNNRNISIIILSIEDITNEYFPELKSYDSKSKPSLKLNDNNFVNKYFSKDEINKIENFKSYKRQIEWISGRYAIKTLINKDHPEIDIKNCNIDTKTGGSPYIVEYPEWHISITHSRGLAAGAISYNANQRIGIDLEKIGEKKPIGFMRLAFTDKEIDYLKNKESKSMYISWCIKEAYMKLVEKGFDMLMKKIEVFDNTIYVSGKKSDNISVHTEIIDEEYILALVNE